MNTDEMNTEEHRRMRHSLAALAVAGLLVGVGAGVRAEIIDRILAVVDGAIIMQSDVALAMRLGLVPSAAAPDPVSAALDKLIERQLMLSEVDRYAPADPAEADIDRHVADIRSRAGAQFDAILLQGGIAIDQLRREVRDDLRIEAYLQQRFGAIQPSEEEILQYYRDHPAAFSQAGVVRSFDDAHDVARAALIAERRGATIRDWIAGLRRRGSVTVLPRS
jgi:hypothetical protein